MEKNNFVDTSIQILSDITAYMKYARYLPELKRRETWFELCTRNVNMHIKKFPFLEKEIIEAYQYVIDKKVLPSMRSIQFSGKPIEINPVRLFNCSYMPINHIDSFSEAMFLLLSGCGLGYSVQQHHIKQLPSIKERIKPIDRRNRKKRYLIGDSIEGWSDAIKILVESYFKGGKEIEFDYRDIRSKGTQLITSGGKAPGPQPLKDCIHDIEKVFDTALEERGNGTQLKTIEAHDLICYIADAVLSGGIRRAALSALFSFNDNDMFEAKFGNWYETNPQRGRANNSVVMLRHKVKKKDFLYLWEKIKASNAGEPGIFWTNDKEMGTNPCFEISLKNNSFCNLTEINASNIENQKDLENRVKYASFIGTLQASYTDFHYLRDIWRETTEEEALLGISPNGICSGDILNLNMEKASSIAIEENKRVAKIIGINPALRLNTVKPSGCRPHYGLVTTKSGIYTLDELFKDHEENQVWGNLKEDIYIEQNKNSNKISKTFYNGETNIYGIEIEGQILLESTLNHKWYVTKNYNRSKKQHYSTINKFIETKDLVIGDIIDINLGVYDKEEHNKLSSINMFQYKMKCNNYYTIKQPKYVDEDLSWLLGYLWGDGTLSEHKYRLRFIDEHLYNIEKAKKIINDKFNLTANIKRCSNRNAYTLEIGSIELYHWLANQGIRKYSNSGIDYIPLIIRKSSWKDIIAFIAGFLDADGSIVECKSCKGHVSKKVLMISQSFKSGFTRHLQDIALSVGIHFGHSFNTLGGNYQKEKSMVLMSSSSFCKEKSLIELAKHSEKAKRKYIDLEFRHEGNSKANRILGKVKSVKFLRKDRTYDIHVENEHWFYAGAVKSHNTASLILGTSSGIHPWHSQYYIRRLRVGKDENIYKYLKKHNPELIEDEFFKPDRQAIISVPIKAPDNAIFRSESAMELLSRVQKISNEWIKPGHIKGSNYHNVSVTVSIRNHEWNEVSDWMWKNRNDYNGISVLPYDGGSYIQAPFEEIDEEAYNKLMIKLKKVDLSAIIEKEDNTNLQGELACSGGNCTVKFL